MTDAAIEGAKQFGGPPLHRIWYVMEQVMTAGLARFDLAFWHWAQSDAVARKVFRRVLRTRFSFAKSLFKEAGFGDTQAEVRARMMVVYMMGESTLISDSQSKRREQLRLKFEILTNP